jgi:hypothetical protein
MKKTFDKLLAMLVFTIAGYVFAYTFIWYQWMKKNVRKCLPKSRRYEENITSGG